MITPKKIQNKEFQRSVRGYKEDEVDDFLDQIIISMDALMRENEALRAQCEKLKRSKLEPVKSDSESVSETLAEAKIVLKQISDAAEKRADILLRNAEEEARRIRMKAENDTESLKRESEQLRTDADDFRRRYEQMLRSELQRLAIEEKPSIIQVDTVKTEKAADGSMEELEKLSGSDIFDDLENIGGPVTDHTMVKGSRKKEKSEFEFSPDKELEELEMMNKATRVFRNGK